jgi:hypothetical protein
LDVEERLEFGGDVLEERENPIIWMFVAESVEDEAVFGYERVSVGWNPFICCRFYTPRNEWRLKTKKAIAFESSVWSFAF